MFWLKKKETFKISAIKIVIYIGQKDNTLKIHIVIQDTFKALSAEIKSYTIPLRFSARKNDDT